MSFRCDRCGEVQERGVQPLKTVTKTRKKLYPERYKQGQDGKPILIDAGGKGWEVVKEEMLCADCLTKE